jgi:hypothetical protein
MGSKGTFIFVEIDGLLLCAEFDEFSGKIVWLIISELRNGL